MKKLLLLSFAILASFAFSSCSNDDDNGFTPAPDAQDKYKGGFYVLNEGQGNASVNYYSSESWTLKLFQTNNDQNKLGVTGTVAVCDQDNMYVVTKMTPFLTKIGLSDFVMKSQLPAGAVSGQACSFALLDSNRGVLSTSVGAYLVTLDPLALADAPFTTQSNKLSGDLFISGGYIFLSGSANQGRDVMVYDATTLKYVKSVGKASTGFAMAAGSVWAANGSKLLRINASTLESEEITLGDGLSVYFNSWNFVPTGLKASKAGDAIYFVNSTANGYNGRDIYKYTIATGKSEKFFTAPVDETDPEKPLTYSVYGAGVNVNPHTGDVYLVYSRDGFSINYLVTDIYQVGADGKVKSRIPYTSESETTYWFPSMLIFR